MWKIRLRHQLKTTEPFGLLSDISNWPVMPLIFYLIDSTVPAYYALILKSLTVLEGLALYADPDFKVLAAAYPYFAKRLLTDPNPYLRDALIELLFKDGKFRLFV